ncbi:MAG: hypothetical protein EVA89_26185, partial [Sandaracinaceae bacterium]
MSIRSIPAPRGARLASGTPRPARLALDAHPRRALLAIALTLAGCGAIHEDALRRDLQDARARLALDPDDAPAPLDGSLEGYVERALRESPALRGEYQRWRAEA